MNATTTANANFGPPPLPSLEFQLGAAVSQDHGVQLLLAAHANARHAQLMVADRTLRTAYCMWEDKPRSTQAARAAALAFLHYYAALRRWLGVPDDGAEDAEDADVYSDHDPKLPRPINALLRGLLREQALDDKDMRTVYSDIYRCRDIGTLRLAVTTFTWRWNKPAATFGELDARAHVLEGLKAFCSEPLEYAVCVAELLYRHADGKVDAGVEEDDDIADLHAYTRTYMPDIFRRSDQSDFSAQHAVDRQ